MDENMEEKIKKLTSEEVEKLRIFVSTVEAPFWRQSKVQKLKKNLSVIN